MNFAFVTLTEAIEGWFNRLKTDSTSSKNAKSGKTEDPPLRLELFSLEQLEAHAKSLATRHAVARQSGPDRLLPRLADNERTLIKAYEQLSEAARAKQRISPAGEWLLDNFHLIEEQIRIAKKHLPPRYSRELPHLTNTPSMGYPRVYDIALDVIGRVDGHIDRENITAFVDAYQKVTPLKLGEFWAIPIMLRLALIENLRRVAVRVIVGMEDRATANHWADRLLKFAEVDPKNLVLAAADMARAKPNLSNSFVAEIVLRLQGQGPALDIPLTWIEHQLAENGRSIQQTVQTESQQQAANQVSVGASIGSLRFLNSLDWRDFVESLSNVEQLLLEDPAGIYGKMDFQTRDQYRHIIEHMAKESLQSEEYVASCALNLARQNSDGILKRERHVGFYLIDKGNFVLEQLLGTPFSLPRAIRRFTKKHRSFMYFGAIFLLATALTAAIVQGLGGVTASTTARDLSLTIGISLLVLLCASQVAISLVNWLATVLVKPALLPKLDFSKKIPPECRTLVAVPTMIFSSENVEELIAGLEVRYLSNRKDNLHFALLTDFADAKTETLPNDTKLLALAKKGIDNLNTKYCSGKRHDLFFLLHRKREWNPQEGVWMGYERKRGKLEALNAFLRAKASNRPNRQSMDSTSSITKMIGGESSAEIPLQSEFSFIVGNTSILESTKYVITLDTDTQLPRDTAQLLIGTMAHPLNHAVYNSKSRRVVEGYSILQPRVAVSLPGSRRSMFARLYSGDPGIDPYTRAVSDVYQDVFQEGSFVGKGIYDVDAFSNALSECLPENLILSHDLIEGCYARSGLVSDVLLYEEHASHYGEEASRRHRWTRGDWQIVYWLFGTAPSLNQKFRKNTLSLLSRWKIFDNLRRSLVPVSTLLLLGVSWFGIANFENPYLFTGVMVAMIFLPPLFTSFAEVVRTSSETVPKSHFLAVAQSMGHQFIQATLSLIFLPQEAVLALDAIAKSWVRMLFTKENLLAWKSAGSLKGAFGTTLFHFYKFMLPSIFLVVAIPAIIFMRHSHMLAIAMPILALWFLAPAVAHWLSRVLPEKEAHLTQNQRAYLHRLARRTWRFFEVFVNAGDNWLPPDNYQEYPVPVVAHRTSPTNIGMSLLANLSAYDFGYIAGPNLLERTANTIKTLKRMERFRGHFYNWYDTVSLMPLTPQYVSTVDTGNFVGALLVLKAGLKELADHPIVSPQTIMGLTTTADMLEASANLKIILSAPITTLSEVKALHLKLQAGLSELDATNDPLNWLSSLRHQTESALFQNVNTFAPWAYLTPITTQNVASYWQSESSKKAYIDLCERFGNFEKLLSLRQIAKIENDSRPYFDQLFNECPENSEIHLWLKSLSAASIEASGRALEQLSLINNLCEECDELATSEYDFLYDKSRRLLAIGYNVTDHRRDASFYDLLASEARLCSYIAIAQDFLPQEHWFSLGRLLTSSNSKPALLSWNGSMFEYLMPLLIMPTFKNTLLDETYQTVVARQIEYGNERGVPWGISESGYNTTDVQLNYQYRAFGVPGLGFKRGLIEDLVITPYATMMSLMVAPREACMNLQRMSDLGFETEYGFYEAIDYTPTRLAPDQPCAIVRSFMSHHQGMGFLGLEYLLLDRKMQQRFHADPLLHAAELLLHERVPKAESFFPHAPEVSSLAHFTGEKETPLRVVSTPHTPRPEVHLLSNGRLSVMLTNAGGGYTRWNNLALSRWREDPTRDNWGSFCYVRDLESNQFWSTSFQPALKEADHYEAIFSQAKVEYRRRDYKLEMHTEITVSPEDDIELRRINITNLSNQKRTIEFTSYAEVVLAPQASDEAHPAFSNLFVQTEIIRSKHAILCTRRPRSNKEHTPIMFHLLNVNDSLDGQVSYETDRVRFVGRGRSVADPLVMHSTTTDLSGSEGSVLDPIVAIRCRLVIEPEQTVKLRFVTGIGADRDKTLKLIEEYHDRHLADRVFELAWTHRQVVLRQLNMTEAEAQLFSRLANSVVYANPSRRAAGSLIAKNRRGQSGLWGYGISGDLPIVLLRIGNSEKIELARQLIHAHGYWRMMGLAVDLVIWNEDGSGYRQLLHEQLLGIIATASSSSLIDKPGGLFIRRPDQMSEEDRILIQTMARAILTDNSGSLADQIERRERPAKVVPLLEVEQKPEAILQPPATTEAKTAPILDLIFNNGIGGFSADGREYVITSSPDQLTPAPWSNVMANPHFGSVVSESGAAYTWCENAHEYRLTPWYNDALTDASGEAFYIRDEETGMFWSPTPLPVRSDTPYVTRHGFGYSVFENQTQEIQSELTTFVAMDAPVKVSILSLRNHSTRARRISVTGYCEWVLGESREKNMMHVLSESDPTTETLLIRNPFHPEFGSRIAFFDSNQTARTFTCDRSEFLGRNGCLAAPNAMTRANLSGKVGALLDPCTAIQSEIILAPGESREIIFVLGVARDVEDVHILLRRFRNSSGARHALAGVFRHWQHTLGALQVRTPDPSVDVLVNGWLLYQVISCRLWGRSGYYQSGGAFGFRDQLQDTMALLHSEPALLREHILRCAAHQYRDGDVQHWWHPPSGRGVRTKCSDDFLWLPLATSRYVLGCGDTGVLNVRVNFIEGRQVKPDEEAYGDLPIRSEASATVYEHCVRAIQRGLQLGPHGLPLIGTGDWNDGMNMVGEKGRGESVWLGFFMYDLLNKFSQVAKLAGDHQFAETCIEQAKKLQANVESTSWDGEWYRRAYFDNGDPLGTATNEECKIDSLAQSWSVLSGAGDPERSQKAMASLDRYLVDRQKRVIKLLDPPFDKSALDPGYIKGYVPGVRENGGQYTHAAIWATMAFAALGQREKAWELFSMINPVNHTRDLAQIKTYKVEPYVISADVYAVSPHTGRGGWSWYTGSAAWMYRLVVETLLGLKLEVDKIRFAPCVPLSWEAFEVKYRFRETLYNIAIKRIEGDPHVVIDGVRHEGSTLTLVNDGVDHVVQVNYAG